MLQGFNRQTTYHIEFNNPLEASFEMGPIRPPSEGQDRSLLLRVNRNCPWNRCLFCSTYRGKKFEYRTLAEVKLDIDNTKIIADGLRKASLAFGLGSEIGQEIVDAVIKGTPEIYGKGVPDEDRNNRLHCLMNVANWLNAGARTVFFQDGNSIIMRVPELLEVLRHLKTVFPSVERVTSYGRSRTASQRSLEELQALNRAGLSRIHVGMESGCDEVLTFMDKGVTGEDHIEGGRKIVAAGISLSEYIMPGLGGRKWSEKHAIDSANVLNRISPDFIRLRSLVARHGLPLYQKIEDGEFQVISEDEMVEEIGLFIENLNCNSYLVSDQMSNLLWEIEGKIPDDKEALLAIINRYLSMLPIERLSFVLSRRARSYLSVHGGLDPRIAAVVEDAVQAIRDERPDAIAKTNRAIMALKTGFV